MGGEGVAEGGPVAGGEVEDGENAGAGVGAGVGAEEFDSTVEDAAGRA